MSARRPKSVLALLGVLVASAALVGCSGQTQPTDYGAQYKANFMFGCTGVEPNSNGDYNNEKLLSQSDCQCIYKGLVDKVPFDDAKKFEQQQSEASSGSDIKIPKNIQAVEDACLKKT